jgi:O-antigen chain-terminating methyltransferase
MKVVRRVAQTVLRPMLDHQSSFNGATARAVSVLRNQGIRHERLLLDLRAAVGEHADAFLEIERTARILEREIEPLSRRRLELDQLALANAFRGSEASVKERQRPYVDAFAGKRNVLDLGCGRGEFLELLREADIEALGVDLDAGMIEHCRGKNLIVEQRGALDYLAGIPDDSIGGVFTAQLIEHFAAFDVVRLIREARRALEPSGRLLIESVNPEALVTFAEFYVDPTHVRPYHAHSIRWLFEQEGFVDIDVELSVDAGPEQPLPPLAAFGIEASAFDQALGTLNTLVYGRRAYAVVGTKPPTP